MEPNGTISSTVNIENSSEIISRKSIICSTHHIALIVIFSLLLIFALLTSIIKPSISSAYPMRSTQKSANNITYTTHKTTGILVKNRFSNFSKFRCTGDENNINAWPERLCVFNNICYDVKKQEFQYYRRPRNPKFPLFYDTVRGMLTQFDINQDKTGFLALTNRARMSWAPVVIDDVCPSINVTWLTNLHTLWEEFDGSNFGHAVWEDMGSIFYSLERMNEFDDQLVIMHVNAVSNQSDFQKFVHEILAALTLKELVQYESYLAQFNTNYICFRRFFAGGNMHLIHATVMKENHGREALLYRWRSKIITYHHFDPEYSPHHHQIVITNKSASIWTKPGSTIHRAIVNLNEVVTFVRTTYPYIPVLVIEWHKISFYKQIEVLLNTTILISPAGGVSMIAPFLPHGAHAILMDYYVNSDSFGFPKGSSASMEGMLLNHFPHFKKDYYQIYGQQDFVFDFLGASDTRNDASILVNVTRLHLLIESAFEDMSH